MAHFAASFDQGKNSLWLDELVADIIDPNEVDEQAVDADAESIRRTQRAASETRAERSRSSTARSGIRTPLDFLGKRRSESYSTAHSRSNTLTALRPYSGNVEDVSETSSPWPGSEQTAFEHRLSLNSQKSNNTTFVKPPPRTVCGVTPSHPEDDCIEKALSSGKSTHSPYNQQRWQPRSELARSKSTNSAISHFSGFAPHPGVRPFGFGQRKSLGEVVGTMVEDDYDYPSPLPLSLIIVGICLSVFTISLDRNVITTAIPRIVREFQSASDIGWYGSAYLLTASAFQPLYGRIYMSFDTKWTFLIALVVFQIASLVCGLANGSNMLIVGRAIQGLGAAGILTGSFVVGTHSVRLQYRPILFAFVGILYGVGALCGPLIGGAFTELVSWRWCFYVNVPIGVVTFVTVFCCFTPHRVEDDEDRASFWTRLFALDWIGNSILLAACTMLFLALQFSEERYGWSSARCIGLIIGFGITILVFIAWLYFRGEKALIPLYIVCQRSVAAACCAAFFIYGGLLLHSYYLPLWFQAVKGESEIGSGVNMIPYMLTNAVFSLIAGIFVSKNGLFAPPAIIGCAIGTIGAGFMATLHPDTTTVKFVGFEVLVAAGLGLAVQQGFSAVQTSLPLEEVPIGTAAVVAAQSLGGAIFVSVGNTLLQNHLFSANNENLIPGVNIRSVVELGATNFRAAVPPESLPALLELYNDALQAAFIAAVPLIGIAFLCSLCMEWKSVRHAPPSVSRSPHNSQRDLEKGLGGTTCNTTTTTLPDMVERSTSRMSYLPDLPPRISMSIGSEGSPSRPTSKRYSFRHRHSTSLLDTVPEIEAIRHRRYSSAPDPPTPKLDELR